jgi:beta-glucanase (GH16 family)
MIKLALIMLILTFCSKQKDELTWNLVWSDEFNYTGLPDINNWGNEVGFIRNNELQYYTDRRLENAKVENGNLLIIGKKEPYETAGYTSASLTTMNKHNWTYGKIEARMKLPAGQGMWPAFWMLGQSINQVGWPECGEIDIMEHINNENIIYGTLHWLNQNHVSSGGKIQFDPKLYHNYSIEWDKDYVKWFLDGEKYWEVPIKDNINSTEEFHKPQYIILNLAIGGSWPGSPDVTTLFPDTMYVDYVRVYQKK